MHIDNFLSQIKTCFGFEKIFILSSDTQIQNLAQKHQIEILHITPPFSTDVPYIFEQTQFWTNELLHQSPIKIDEFAIIDHRDIQFADNNLKEVLSKYNHCREAGVIGVTLCQDHPCQFRLYSNFLGSTIFQFPWKNQHSVRKPLLKNSIHKTIQPLRNDWSKIKICITIKERDSGTGIFIDCQKAPVKDLIAHILPYDSDGPLYNHFAYAKISCFGVKTFIREDYSNFSGAIITLLMDNCSSDYDTVEFFTPQNANWELGTMGNMVINKKNHTPIQGRQQFSQVYSYNGAFYASRTDSFMKKTINPMPIILEQSSIVTDWVEYHGFSAKQQADDFSFKTK
jgi:hypothetical protein